MPLLRFWSWTSGQANAPLNVGAARFRAWTSATTGITDAPLSIGALRFSPWTSAPGTAPLSIGALRFMAWASGEAIPPEPTPPQLIVGGVPFPLPGLTGRLLREDEEIILAICAWLVARGRR